ATQGNASLQMWIDGWLADYPDPQDWLGNFFEKGAGYNQFNYGQNNTSDAAQQQAVQQQLAQADMNQNQTSRLQAYDQAEQQIVNDVGWLPLWQSQGTIVINPKVVGNPFVNALEYVAPDSWADIYITT